MSSVILKENETLDSALRRFKRSCGLWTAHCAASREAVRRQASSRKFVRENITKSLA